MNLDLILFLVLALVAIATAMGMLLSRNAVYSALFLVLNFATVAVFYLLLGAPFIAMAQITVYAGRDHGALPVRHHAAGRGKPASGGSPAVAATVCDRAGCYPRE